MIIESFKHISILNKHVLGMQKTNIRCFSLSNITKGVFKYFKSQPPTPPYNHVCQAGDPVLRSKATPVDPKELQTPEFEKLLDQLCKVMRKYKIVGISAPQIGVSLQVFAIEVEKESVKQLNPAYVEVCEMEPVPLTYFINPTMKIINPEKVTLVESCGSLIGYQAEVERAKEIEIKALNRLGEPFCWRAKGWTARIAQHEFDHLNGILYVNRMNPSTFDFYYWEELNAKKGKVQLKYIG